MSSRGNPAISNTKHTSSISSNIMRNMSITTNVPCWPVRGHAAPRAVRIAILSEMSLAGGGRGLTSLERLLDLGIVTVHARIPLRAPGLREVEAART